VPYSRFSLPNLLPEEGQLMAGFSIAPAMDSLLSSAQAADLKRVTRDVYAEMARDPEFRELGSAMGNTYEAMLFGRSQEGHCYVPSSVPAGKPAPVLIFFHGAGGNFKGYLWVLSKVAERTGFMIVAPTGGPGA
jgi:poly(3-hydroxybutyrate) depolymerase